MENNQIFEMADRLKAMQEQKKDLEAQAKTLGAEIDALDSGITRKENQCMEWRKGIPGHPS